MSAEQVLSHCVTDFTKAIDHLKHEYAKLQVGRANPAVVESIMVDVYGAMQPIKNIANISVPEPRSLAIQPWDKAHLVGIEKAISHSGLGLNPMNDGAAVRINIPPLTEERRADLTKVVKKLAEEAKISIRNVRQDAINKFKSLKNDNELTEDDVRSYEKKLQDKVDSVNTEIDSLSKSKENDVMTI